MAKTNWYVLYTKPRAEKQVNERLRAMPVESYLPLHRTPSVWSDRVKMVDKPLFSSYIFVRCCETELRSLLYVNGVVRIVYYCGRPAVIRQKEIDTIGSFLEQAANHALCVGEEVEIISGALKRVSGKIRKNKKNYLLLYIEQIGATVSVNLSNVTHINRT
jgi:transcription antitermination factor NusG